MASATLMLRYVIDFQQKKTIGGWVSRSSSSSSGGTICSDRLQRRAEVCERTEEQFTPTTKTYIFRLESHARAACIRLRNFIFRLFFHVTKRRVVVHAVCMRPVLGIPAEGEVVFFFFSNIKGDNLLGIPTAFSCRREAAGESDGQWGREVNGSRLLRPICRLPALFTHHLGE